jgi:hypothetical protein
MRIVATRAVFDPVREIRISRAVIIPIHRAIAKQTGKIIRICLSVVWGILIIDFHY